MGHDVYIRGETLVSMGINGVLSLVFFVLVFGRMPVVPTWGMGNWVFDFLPQSFMIAFMGTIVPGTIAANGIDGGKLERSQQISRLPDRLIVRGLLLSVISAVAGFVTVAVSVLVSGVVSISWWPALALKVVYGIALAAIVTPIGLHAALARVQD